MEWFDYMYFMVVFLIMIFVRYGVNIGFESFIIFLIYYFVNIGFKLVCIFNLNILYFLESCFCYCSFRW